MIEHDLRALHYPDYKKIANYLKKADVCFSNLEVAIMSENAGEPTKEGTFFHAAKPEVLDCLKDWSIDLLSLSNNHAWDFGTDGILATIDEVKQRGFVCAGTGADEKAAMAPGYLTTPRGKVALIAMASGGVAAEAVANESRPGVNELKVENGKVNQEDAKRNLASIKEASANADYVFVYQHNHYWEPDRQQTATWQKAWAKACIDAGAMAFIGHGVPLLHGIEIYKKRPIFYSLGNFVFHTRTPPGHYESAVWQSVIADCQFSGREILSINLVPIVLNEGSLEDKDFYRTRGKPSLAKGNKAIEILERLKKLSPDLGTHIEINENLGLIQI